MTAARHLSPEEQDRIALAWAVKKTRQLIDAGEPAQTSVWTASLSRLNGLYQIPLAVATDILTYSPGTKPNKLADGNLLVVPLYNRRRLYGAQLIDREGRSAFVRGTKRLSLDAPAIGSTWTSPGNTETVFFGTDFRDTLVVSENTSSTAAYVPDPSTLKTVLLAARVAWPESALVVADSPDDEISRVIFDACRCTGGICITTRSLDPAMSWYDCLNAFGVAEVRYCIDERVAIAWEAAR